MVSFILANRLGEEQSAPHNRYTRYTEVIIRTIVNKTRIWNKIVANIFWNGVLVINLHTGIALSRYARCIGIAEAAYLIFMLLNIWKGALRLDFQLCYRTSPACEFVGLYFFRILRGDTQTTAGILFPFLFHSSIGFKYLSTIKPPFNSPPPFCFEFILWLLDKGFVKLMHR